MDEEGFLLSLTKPTVNSQQRRRFFLTLVVGTFLNARLCTIDHPVLENTPPGEDPIAATKY